MAKADDTLFRTEKLIRGRFLERSNRFIVRYETAEGASTAYMANPGKLGEILLPEVDLLLAERPHTKHGREVVGATWRQRWAGDEPRTVYLNTGQMNRLARRLLEEKSIPELAHLDLVRGEFPVGGSRFDFLLQDADGPYLLEVKSVSLVEWGTAMFPDARTDRGRRHIEELARLRSEGYRTGVLFLVQGKCERFQPDCHNDLEFARTFLECRERVEYLPYELTPRLDRQRRICFDGSPRRLSIDWPRIERTARDSGLYLICLDLPERRIVPVGGLGELDLEAGTYVYTGSAQVALTKRIERHSRTRKTMHWHIDHLRAVARGVSAFPIRGLTQECELADAVTEIGVKSVKGFGSSDCGCPGHLVRFESSPVRTASFQRLLTRWRHTVASD